MAQKSWTREEICAYALDGWSFRVKTSKNRRYITRRKGQIERSLGPYTKELWNTIEEIRTQKSEGKGVPMRIDTDNGVNLLSRATREESEYNIGFGSLYDTILNERAINMMINCLRKDNEGFCAYWRWNNKPYFFQSAQKLFLDEDIKKKKIKKDKEVMERWVVKALPWFCRNCPEYISSAQISFIKKKLEIT